MRRFIRQPLVINIEAKMAEIIRNISVIANNSIFRLMMQYFISQNNIAEGVLPNDEF